MTHTQGPTPREISVAMMKQVSGSGASPLPVLLVISDQQDLYRGIQIPIKVKHNL